MDWLQSSLLQIFLFKMINIFNLLLFFNFKSNPNYPPVEKVRDEIIQMLKVKLSAAY
jgi:hypothetical protein